MCLVRRSTLFFSIFVFVYVNVAACAGPTWRAHTWHRRLRFCCGAAVRCGSAVRHPACANLAPPARAHQGTGPGAYIATRVALTLLVWRRSYFGLAAVFAALYTYDIENCITQPGNQTDRRSAALHGNASLRAWSHVPQTTNQ